MSEVVDRAPLKRTTSAPEHLPEAREPTRGQPTYPANFPWADPSGLRVIGGHVIGLGPRIYTNLSVGQLCIGAVASGAVSYYGQDLVMSVAGFVTPVVIATPEFDNRPKSEKPLVFSEKPINLPNWVMEFYSAPRDKAPRSYTRMLIVNMRDLLETRNFEAIDHILAFVEWDKLPPEIAMGLPRTSAVVRDKLPHWNGATLAATAELRRRGLPSEEIMIGLLDKVNDGPHSRSP
jgi:hypothetical protein